MRLTVESIGFKVSARVKLWKMVAKINVFSIGISDVSFRLFPYCSDTIYIFS